MTSATSGLQDEQRLRRIGDSIQRDSFRKGHFNVFALVHQVSIGDCDPFPSEIDGVVAIAVLMKTDDAPATIANSDPNPCQTDCDLG
jgi:hypothetical protein